MPTSFDGVKGSRMNCRKPLFTAALALLVAACATSPTGRRQLMLVSEEQAISSSRQAYAQEMGKYQKEGSSSPIRARSSA